MKPEWVDLLHRCQMIVAEHDHAVRKYHHADMVQNSTVVVPVALLSDICLHTYDPLGWNTQSILDDIRLMEADGRATMRVPARLIVDLIGPKKSIFDYWKKAINKYSPQDLVRDIKRFRKPKSHLTSPWSPYDEVAPFNGGLHVIATCTGGGKTTMARQLAQFALQQDIQVMFLGFNYSEMLKLFTDKEHKPFIGNHNTCIDGRFTSDKPAVLIVDDVSENDHPVEYMHKLHDLARSHSNLSVIATMSIRSKPAYTKEDFTTWGRAPTFGSRGAVEIADSLLVVLRRNTVGLAIYDALIMKNRNGPRKDFALTLIHTGQPEFVQYIED